MYIKQKIGERKIRAPLSFIPFTFPQIWRDQIQHHPTLFKLPLTHSLSLSLSAARAWRAGRPSARDARGSRRRARAQATRGGRRQGGARSAQGGARPAQVGADRDPARAHAGEATAGRP